MDRVTDVELLVLGVVFSIYRVDGQKVPMDLFHDDDGATILNSPFSNFRN